MRIGVLNEYFYPDNTGGTGTVLSELARKLRDNYPGVEIEVVTSRNLYRANGSDAPLTATEDWDGIAITRIATPKPNGKPAPVRLAINALFSAAAFLHMARRRYDVLLVATAPPTAPIAAGLLKRLRGVPYVYAVYDLEPDRAVTMRLLPSGHPLARLLKSWQRRWLRAASTTVVLGRCMKEHVQAAYGLPDEKIQVIAIGADPSLITPRERDTAFRRREGLDGFVALYSGNFGRYHNFDTVLDAAKTLAARGVEATFVLVGDGAQKAHIVSRVEREQIGNVRVYPFVPQSEYSDLLASADASLVTLEPGMEGICVPSKFYSILASGRPTIAMVGPTSEVARVVGEADCGVQIAQGEAGKLADAVAAMIEQPERCAAMGRNARRELASRYAADTIVERYYQTFVAAIREAQAGSGGAAAVVTSHADAPLAWRSAGKQ